MEGNSDQSGIFGSEFIRMEESSEFRNRIKNRFLESLEGFDLKAELISIYQPSSASKYWEGKSNAFQNYMKIHQEMGGNPNMRQAWFTSSKNLVVSMLSRGYFAEITNKGIYGQGVYLWPHHLTVDCVQSSIADGEGVRHLVFCKVIMGRMEVIRPISKQSCSSSKEYHSGVDDLLHPTKYIVWNSHMNSHIVPLFVITFRCSKTNFANHVVSCSSKELSPCTPRPALVDPLFKASNETLVHASRCSRDSGCTNVTCQRLKKLFSHANTCSRKRAGGCEPCEMLWKLLLDHAMRCKDVICLVPRCRDMKKYLPEEIPPSLSKALNETLVHASRCLGDSGCTNVSCQRLKKLFSHGGTCSRKRGDGCKPCEMLWKLLVHHAMRCNDVVCLVPRCRDTKKYLAEALEPPVIKCITNGQRKIQ